MTTASSFRSARHRRAHHQHSLQGLRCPNVDGRVANHRRLHDDDVSRGGDDEAEPGAAQHLGERLAHGRALVRDRDAQGRRQKVGAVAEPNGASTGGVDRNERLLERRVPQMQRDRMRAA